MPREALIQTAQRVYRSFGFVPIDTPVLEKFEILSGKGGEETDRQMYHFRDGGDRHVGMRFDLTVPLARFAAQHINELGTPFKRYHIAKVWRGEKPQDGRYREFMQCDFDTIGTTSIASDIETGLVINDLLQAIGFDRFTIQVNHRKILSGLLEKLDLAEHGVAVLRCLDKLTKIGRAKVAEEMQSNTGAPQEKIDAVLKLAEVQGTNEEIISELEPLVEGSELGLQGLNELRQFNNSVKATCGEPHRFKIVVSVARGLDYYTGMIFETFLTDLPDIGSVCSGGRYDDLANLYTKQKLPGIGASLGLDRLLTAMQKLEMIPKSRTSADLLIVYFDKDRMSDYLSIASKIRAAGLGVELYPEPKKMGQQLKYADRQGFRAALIAGGNEFENSQVQIKWLQSKEQAEVALSENCAEIIEHLRERISV